MSYDSWLSDFIYALGDVSSWFLDRLSDFFAAVSGNYFLITILTLSAFGIVFSAAYGFLYLFSILGFGPTPFSRNSQGANRFQRINRKEPRNKQERVSRSQRNQSKFQQRQSKPQQRQQHKHSATAFKAPTIKTPRIKSYKYPFSPVRKPKPKKKKDSDTADALVSDLHLRNSGGPDSGASSVLASNDDPSRIDSLLQDN